MRGLFLLWGGVANKVANKCKWIFGKLGLVLQLTLLFHFRNKIDEVPNGCYNINIKQYYLRGVMMTIKEIRKITGLSQADFGEYYNIPLPTIKKWESTPDNQNHRNCPPYVNQLLERVVKIDFLKEENIIE